MNEKTSRADQEKEYGFKLGDIVEENRDKVEELIKIGEEGQRTPEQEQEFKTLVSGRTNDTIRQNDEARKNSN